MIVEDCLRFFSVAVVAIVEHETAPKSFSCKMVDALLRRPIGIR